MREIAWIEREGGGPVRVRDRVRIDNTIIKPGGVDRFEFEFEFGSTTQLSSRGGWTGSSSSSSSDRHTIIEPGGVDRFEFEFEFGSTTQSADPGRRKGERARE